MKTLSLVNCTELKFCGNILKNAIYFGDVDNDGLNELIIGNQSGDLAVFRGDKCIYTSSDLGTIACITVGDLLNIGRNVLVVVTIEGWCHIFDVENESNNHSSNLQLKQQENEPDCTMIWPFHSQRIPPNAKCMHLGDVNEDDLNELIIGLTDRVLRTYVWKNESMSDYHHHQDERDDDVKSECSEVYDGRLFSVNKWEFAHQIGSVTLQKRDKYNSIIVGNPGGSVTHIIETKKSKRMAPSSLPSSSNYQSLSSGSSGIHPNNNSSNNYTTNSTNNSNNSKQQQQQNRTPQQERPTAQNDSISLVTYPLDFSRMQNQNITSEVCGNIASSDGKAFDHYAVATLDGTISIALDDKIIQSLQVDNQILSIHQVNGKLVVCAWNGDTYLLDISQKDPIRFHFEDSVAAFFAGYYAMNDDNSNDNNGKLVNTTCLAYATFGERVFVYDIEYL